MAGVIHDRSQLRTILANQLRLVNITVNGATIDTSRTTLPREFIIAITEELNAFFKYSATTGFQAWKTLVDILRLMKLLSGR